MNIDISKQIQLDPNNPDNTSTVKAIAMQALFSVSNQVVSRDKAQQLYQLLDDNTGEISVEAGDVETMKKAVDAGFVRGVSWQFADLVDPTDKPKSKSNKK